jgi:hypothetical protein
MQATIKEINAKMQSDIEINWEDHVGIYNKLMNKVNGYKAQLNALELQADKK